MDKTSMGVIRSRAKAEICTHGGYVVGSHKTLPLVYAMPPLAGCMWPVEEIPQRMNGVVEIKRVSRINGCTVIWN